MKNRAARLSTHSCRALQALLGSCFCCFDSQLLLLRLAKMKKKKTLCRPHAGVPGTIRKQLRLQEGACPLSLLLRWGITATWSDSGQDLAAPLLRPEPGEQLRAATAHITPPLPRWEHGKTQSSKAGERRVPREKRLCCPAHSMGRMTSIVRLLKYSFGITPSAAFEFNTHFWVCNRKRWQNHEAGGRKKRDNSTSSRER